MYLPNRATIDEACEWLHHQTGQKWTLPRLLEEGHLVPYVWIDYVEGLSQIFGDRREGYLTKMVYHGDVVRLAADRSEALLTMFTAHDGNLIRPTPGWRVDLKDIRFLKNDLQRVAEIINKAAQPQAVPVADSADDGEAWKAKARERADEIIKRQRAKDLHPSQEDIADEIAREFRAGGVVGAGGKPLTGAYIKRHALKGISSAQNRQLSTSIRRGK
jgi:hypothetical protein